MALRRGRQTISRAYDWAHDAAEGAHLGNLRLPQRGDLSHLTQANPLLLGAVGLGLGVAIGTLFPRGVGGRASRRGRRPDNGSAVPVKAARRRRRKARTSTAKARATTAAAS